MHQEGCASHPIPPLTNPNLSTLRLVLFSAPSKFSIYFVFAERMLFISITVSEREVFGGVVILLHHRLTETALPAVGWVKGSRRSYRLCST
jgi:hypothetical protein